MRTESLFSGIRPCIRSQKFRAVKKFCRCSRAIEVRDPLTSSLEVRPAGFVHRFPHFSADGLIPQTAFLLETGPSFWERGSMHQFPQFSQLKTIHYHDCAQCRRSFACVCQTPRKKIFCLECWEETKQKRGAGDLPGTDVWQVARD